MKQLIVKILTTEGSPKEIALDIRDVKQVGRIKGTQYCYVETKDCNFNTISSFEDVASQLTEIRNSLNIG